jgi:hypothetical protein
MMLKCSDAVVRKCFGQADVASEPPMAAYRTETPDLLVYIRAAMFIDASSWKSSFAAYGMCTCEILVLFLQGRHSNVFRLRFLAEIVSAYSYR